MCKITMIPRRAVSPLLPVLGTEESLQVSRQKCRQSEHNWCNLENATKATTQSDQRQRAHSPLTLLSLGGLRTSLLVPRIVNNLLRQSFYYGILYYLPSAMQYCFILGSHHSGVEVIQHGETGAELCMVHLDVAETRVYPSADFKGDLARFGKHTLQKVQTVRLFTSCAYCYTTFVLSPGALATVIEVRKVSSYFLQFRKIYYTPPKGHRSLKFLMMTFTRCMFHSRESCHIPNRELLMFPSPNHIDGLYRCTRPVKTA